MISVQILFPTFNFVIQFFIIQPPIFIFQAPITFLLTIIIPFLMVIDLNLSLNSIFILLIIIIFLILSAYLIPLHQNHKLLTIPFINDINVNGRRGYSH